MDYITKEIQKRMVVINTAGKVVNTFADENNFLTVASIMNGLRKGITTTVHIVIIVIVFICILSVGIYILVSLNTVKKARAKSANYIGSTISEEEAQSEAKSRAEAIAQANNWN